MTSRELVLRSRRVVTPDAIRPAWVRIRDGSIVEIGQDDEIPPQCELVDVGDRIVMPGLVDTHVHINEPGRTKWEGFETATRAAAAGGVTTLFDMPLNSIPPTTTVEAVRTKREAAAGRSWVDIGFWGGLVCENMAELEPLREAGVFGFKCFLAPSGVSEFPEVTEAELRPAMAKLARIGAPLLVHAESPKRLAALEGRPDRYRSYLESRPRAAENDAIALMVRLCSETKARVHILHLSSAEALESLAQAKQDGLPVTAETCPHYLFFTAEEIPDGATEFKCAPPIRERENRERLWEALRKGLIDMVVSDHSPSPPELKHRDSGDFARAWGGISSLQLGLSATWTAASARGFSVGELADWMCRAPAKLARLDSRKGSIAVGQDADLVVWDPDALWKVEPAQIHHRHKLTPYAGRILKGVVELTYLNGEKIYERGHFASRPSGELLFYTQ